MPTRMMGTPGAWCSISGYHYVGQEISEGDPRAVEGVVVVPCLGFDVVKGGRADYGEADEEDVRLRVGEGPQSVVVFLTRGIP